VYNRFPQDIHNVNNFLSTKVIHIIHNYVHAHYPKPFIRTGIYRLTAHYRLIYSSSLLILEAFSS